LTRKCRWRASGFQFSRRPILAELHLGVELGRLVADAKLDGPIRALVLGEAFGRCGPEREAALLIAQRVLEYPIPRTAGAKPKAEPWYLVVPFQMIGLPSRQFERRNRLGCQFH
jgi:hypothetical protein